jgi:hypothetical protein
MVGGGASPLPSAQSGPRWTSGEGAARATASMGTSARAGSGGGAVPTAAHPPAAMVVLHFHSRYPLHLLPPCPPLFHHLFFACVLDLIS